MRTAQIDFGRKLRDWDGFGVNYVQTHQTRDPDADPEDYGGFSLMEEIDRLQIVDLVFGDEGLRPGLVKMFLDPFHQAEPDGPFDHAKTADWMTWFAKQGLERTRARGGDLEIIVTLYGPPAWATRQRFVRGRDLDPARKRALAAYMMAWAKHLRQEEGLPVRYLSLHNEGEDWLRWPDDGSGPGGESHDHNLYWPVDQVVDFLRFMREMLDAEGLGEVGLTPGETSNWYRFHTYGYADAIAEDAEALANLGLITSHGFFGPRVGRWFGDWRSAGADTLRARRPDLRAWVTSTSWSRMDVGFVNELANSIYSAKVNGLIPWAALQRSGRWKGGDPNPGTAIRIEPDGRWRPEPGYWHYKGLCRAGQPGTAVCPVRSNDPAVGLMAFGSNGTPHPDAWVALNLDEEATDVAVEVLGSSSDRFRAFRASPEESYEAVGELAAKNGRLACSLPPKSVTTFFGA